MKFTMRKKEKENRKNFFFLFFLFFMKLIFLLALDLLYDIKNGQKTEKRF